MISINWVFLLWKRANTGVKAGKNHTCGKPLNSQVKRKEKWEIKLSSRFHWRGRVDISPSLLWLWSHLISSPNGTDPWAPGPSKRLVPREQGHCENHSVLISSWPSRLEDFYSRFRKEIILIFLAGRILLHRSQGPNFWEKCLRIWNEQPVNYHWKENEKP